MVQSRDEEAAPTPSAGSPTLFRFKSQWRCLTCTLQTGGGRQENPHCKLRRPSSQQSPQGSKHRRGTDKHRQAAVSLLCLYYFLGFPFSWKRKAFLGDRLARACLGVQVGVWDPFLPGKEREGGEQT